MEYEGGINKP